MREKKDVLNEKTNRKDGNKRNGGKNNVGS
jgi:hypothetical protein